VQDLLGQIHDYEVWHVQASDYLHHLNIKGGSGGRTARSVSRLIAELEKREEETRKDFNRSWTKELEPVLRGLAGSFGIFCVETVPTK
jgi:hypothetical protein